MLFRRWISATAAYGSRRGDVRVAMDHKVSCGWTTTVGAGPVAGSDARDAVVNSTALARDAMSTKNASTTARPLRVSRSGGWRRSVVTMALLRPSRREVERPGA